MARKAIHDFIRYKNLLLLVFTQLLLFFVLVKQEVNLELISLVLSTIFAAAGGNIINDLLDMEADKVNKPNQKILSGFSAFSAYCLYSSCVMFSLFFSFFLSFNATLLIFLNNLLLFFYSKSFKGLPLVGNFVVSFLASSALLLFLLVYQQSKLEIFVFSAFTFFIHFIREIIKDIEDVEGDKVAHYKTFPLLVGITVTKRVVVSIEAFFFVLLLILSMRLTKSLLVYNMVFSMPLLILIMTKTIKANKKEHFSNISSWCKLLMFFGVLGVFFC